MNTTSTHPLNPYALLPEMRKMVGQHEVKNQVADLLEKLSAYLKMQQTVEGYTPRIIRLNFIFAGNPGTGKTTFARLIGEGLRRIGVFPPTEGSIISVYTGTELLGYSTDDIKKLFEDNIGKVVFIDEADGLKSNPRVLVDMLENISDKDFMGKLSVIFAGYPDQMNQLVNNNPALARRFTEMPFSDYTNVDLYRILTTIVASSPHAAMSTHGCLNVGIDYFASIPRNSNFGNAHEAWTLFNKLLANRDARVINASEEQLKDRDFTRMILPEDFPNFNK